LYELELEPFYSAFILRQNTGSTASVTNISASMREMAMGSFPNFAFPVELISIGAQGASNSKNFGANACSWNIRDARPNCVVAQSGLQASGLPAATETATAAAAAGGVVSAPSGDVVTAAPGGLSANPNVPSLNVGISQAQSVGKLREAQAQLVPNNRTNSNAVNIYSVPNVARVEVIGQYSLDFYQGPNCNGIIPGQNPVVRYAWQLSADIFSSGGGPIPVEASLISNPSMGGVLSSNSPACTQDRLDDDGCSILHVLGATTSNLGHRFRSVSSLQCPAAGNIESLVNFDNVNLSLYKQNFFERANFKIRFRSNQSLNLPIDFARPGD